MAPNEGSRQLKW